MQSTLIPKITSTPEPRTGTYLRLSPSGERKEKAAEADVRAGRFRTFEDAEDLIRDLNEERLWPALRNCDE